MKGLSRVRGNSDARFLEGWAAGKSPTYSLNIIGQMKWKTKRLVAKAPQRPVLISLVITSCIAKKGQAISAGMLLSDKDLGDPKRRDPWGSFPGAPL